MIAGMYRHHLRQQPHHVLQQRQVASARVSVMAAAAIDGDKQRQQQQQGHWLTYHRLCLVALCWGIVAM